MDNENILSTDYKASEGFVDVCASTYDNYDEGCANAPEDTIQNSSSVKEGHILYTKLEREEILRWWHYKIGANVIPADNCTIPPLIMWKNGNVNYQKTAMSDEEFEKFLAAGIYDKGAVIATGLLRHGPSKGMYLVRLDADNAKGIKIVCTAINDLDCTLEQLAKQLTIEKHVNQDKVHFYFISSMPFSNKTSDINDISIGRRVVNGDLPAVEVHSESEFLSYCLPCIHNIGLQTYILGARSIVFVSPEKVKDIQRSLAEQLKEYGITYLVKNVDDYEQDIEEQYLRQIDRRKDADILLQLIKDDMVEVFRSGTNNQVYLIAPNYDYTCNVQIQVPSADFNTYSRRMFARDYERIKPIIKIREALEEIRQLIEKSTEDDVPAKLKEDKAKLSDKLSTLLQNYEEEYGHRVSIHDEVAREDTVNSVEKQLHTLATTTRELHLRSFIDKNGCWYYDLQNDNYEYILITKDGYTIENDGYYYFRRTISQATNDTPELCSLEEAKSMFDDLSMDLAS